MKLISLITCLALSLSLLVPGVCLSGANSQASVYLDYSSDAKGPTTIIAVYAEQTKNLKGFDIEIVADSSQLVILEQVSEGDFLSSSGGKTFFLPKVYDGKRLWVANAVAGKGGLYTPSGAGLLFTFKVKHLANHSNTMEITQLLTIKKAVLADSTLEKDLIVGEDNR